jgi:hypothetical protein
LAEYPLQGRAGSGVTTMKLGMGERIATATIATMNDLVVIVTLRGKFKVMKFSGAPHVPRNAKGDFVGLSLTKSDRVRTVMQIVQRPAPPEPPPAKSNGSHE